MDGWYGQEKKQKRWLDGYKKWMDIKMDGWIEKNRCMVRWIHYFNVWIEQTQVNSWKDERRK